MRRAVVAQHAHCFLRFGVDAVWAPPGLSCLVNVLPVPPDPRGPTNPEASMGYSGFSGGFFSSADWVFVLSMLTEERRRAVLGDWMRPSESSAALARSSWRRSAPGDRAEASGESGRMVYALPTRVLGAIAALWLRALDGQGERGEGAGFSNMDYLVLINWI